MSGREPLAAIFGCAGTVLTPDERAFFRDADPVGFILFARNCATPDQLRGLVAELRAAIARDDAPVLIDQEGGRVARLGPPHWRAYPSARRIAAAGEEAARLGARLTADDLAALGITVDCLPVLDLPAADADPIIGDRAYGERPDTVIAMGRAVCEGLLAGGVLPVMKHIPGHGRATVDSHRALPRVEAPLAALAARDFLPFRALAQMPWAMTAHVVYGAIDPDDPATVSAPLIAGTIRGRIGFDGFLVSDDLSMAALAGTIGARASRALAAGCDVVLHCNGHMDEMTDVAASARPLAEAGRRRLDSGEALRKAHLAPFDRREGELRFAALMGGEG
ncbi:MAG TPA: beta-N-acetylhexosaminidase [Stellaceae bacterium]|nr:beta-N-acetylhexosaminidase [Stellaceae bacterium]